MKSLPLPQQHEVLLGPVRDLQSGNSPLLLQRADEDFIEAVLDELRSPQGRQALQKTRAAVRSKQVLKLFQPVQRQHHLALMEAWCDTPGTPRIDPKRVDSAGLVVRRVRSGTQAEYSGWMRSKGHVRGWMPVARIGGAQRDPASALRLGRADTGVGDIDVALREIALRNDDALLNEHVVPMFMAPPDVCKAAGKTVFYGLVPTVSSELSEAPAVFDEEGSFGPESADFLDHLVQALRGGLQTFPMAGVAIDPDWYSAADAMTTEQPAGVSNDHWNQLKPGGSERSAMQLFLRLLRQLDTEFNAFEGVGPAFDALRGFLASVALALPLLPGETVARTTRADVFLRQAADALLKQETGAARPLMPTHWPSLGAQRARELRQALSAALTQRFSEINTAAGRFEEDTAQYVVSCFVRLKPEGGCPARTLWTQDSEAFVIAPWYEGSGAPPVKISLPDASNRDLLKSLKPNVSFVLPKALQKVLSGNPKDLMEGKPGSTNFGIGWICSFSIPIITLCAFIVLSIFLSLFDIFLRWMAFIKICLPYPKKGE
jgi:hypothetical protein